MKNRKDLTEWIIHFVHDRKIDNESSVYFGNLGEYHDFPDNFSYEGEPMYQTEQYQEDEYALEEDASAFSVLRKIIHDGIIKSG